MPCPNCKTGVLNKHIGPMTFEGVDGKGNVGRVTCLTSFLACNRCEYVEEGNGNRGR